MSLACRFAIARGGSLGRAALCGKHAAVSIGRGAVRKMRQNLCWAIGYNSLAIPIAAGVFEPWGLTLRPEIAAISMSGSSVLVALNALALKRLHLPRRRLPTDGGPHREPRPVAAAAGAEDT